jgi:hypothetical protein
VNVQLAVAFGGPVLAGIVAWLCTRGYYRAAYGDRYQRGYDDGRAAQIRAYQAARYTLPPWEQPGMLPAPPPPASAADAHGGDDIVRVLGSWYPEASGPPRYAQLPPEQLDGGPPTSEWARDLISGIERWNDEHLGNGNAPWPG